MPSKLREFIYLDDVSLNSHLSSLGAGVPQEIIELSEHEKETEGEAGAKIAGIGGGGRHVRTGLSSEETRLSVTAPYRFEKLRSMIIDEEFEIYENPDPRSVARGDIVRIQGKTVPMSIYKFEVAVNAFLEIFDESVIESLDQIGDGAEDGADQTGVNMAALTTLRAFSEVIEKFTGNTIPLRIECEDEGYVFGTSLIRSKMRADARRAFFEEKDYTLFGRVDQRILSPNYWDPIDATNVVGRYADEAQLDPDEFRRDIREGAEELGIEMTADDLLLEGHTAVIHPIAVYW